MRLGELGLDPQRLLVVCDRFLRLPSCAQSDPEVVVRLGKIGIEPQRLLVLRHRLLRPCPVRVNTIPRLLCASAQRSTLANRLNATEKTSRRPQPQRTAAPPAAGQPRSEVEVDVRSKLKMPITASSTNAGRNSTS